MNDDNAPHDLNGSTEARELPAIEFESPGRFAVHNPEPPQADAGRREPAPFRLGEHLPLERFDRPEQARAHALALLQQARRSLCIFSDDLEPWLYHHSSVQDACTAFLLASPKNHLRILLRDATRAVKEGHRLLSLSRRLSSNLQIRKLHPDYPGEDIAFLLADDRGLLLRPEPEQFAGYALYQDPARVRLRQAQFDQAWETSISDPDLRSFLL
ncbi:histone acetyltransferase HPA2 [Pseudomonas lalucatii]|uniref:Histone acetyltransferase HPA2 n=1 Tax=Pseudomonas lalucatii TaxID=1424203 RepID=A0ABS5PVC4_9PSED|nr:histone acetyltransferase HPA2 [Pseudomonas lalucatii]MBS7660495.1 histone acetyltransferase HPA2 [Pseudomonas lalucatii]MBS7691289.1 histone acetyltransferase HPA2 [Pseudomonas lalucatii]QVM88975.1 histone acetyltransferase HPA2 [Pseudomonas lalucatii]